MEHDITSFLKVDLEAKLTKAGSPSVDMRKIQQSIKSGFESMTINIKGFDQAMKQEGGIADIINTGFADMKHHLTELHDKIKHSKSLLDMIYDSVKSLKAEDGSGVEKLFRAAFDKLADKRTKKVSQQQFFEDFFRSFGSINFDRVFSSSDLDRLAFTVGEKVFPKINDLFDSSMRAINQSIKKLEILFSETIKDMTNNDLKMFIEDVLSDVAIQTVKKEISNDIREKTKDLDKRVFVTGELSKLFNLVSKPLELMKKELSTKGAAFRDKTGKVHFNIDTIDRLQNLMDKLTASRVNLTRLENFMSQPIELSGAVGASGIITGEKLMNAMREFKDSIEAERKFIVSGTKDMINISKQFNKIDLAPIVDNLADVRENLSILNSVAEKHVELTEAILEHIQNPRVRTLRGGIITSGDRPSTQ